MAQFIVSLPKEVIDEVNSVYKNADKIFGGMTKAGAEVCYKNIINNMPNTLRSSDFKKCLRVTRNYKTGDGAMNTKVGVYDYFLNKNNKRTPAPLVVNLFNQVEYGKHNYPKHPFWRRSFNKYQIEKAMLQAQVKLSKGLLK